MLCLNSPQQSRQLRKTFFTRHLFKKRFMNPQDLKRDFGNTEYTRCCKAMVSLIAFQKSPLSINESSPRIC